MAKGMAEWQNGRKWIHKDTCILFTVHADNDTNDDDDDDNDDDDDDDEDTLIFYSIDDCLNINSYVCSMVLSSNQHPTN